jgi:hypothetical protein
MHREVYEIYKKDKKGTIPEINEFYFFRIALNKLIFSMRECFQESECGLYMEDLFYIYSKNVKTRDTLITGIKKSYIKNKPQVEFLRGENWKAEFARGWLPKQKEEKVYKKDTIEYFLENVNYNKKVLRLTKTERYF